MNDELFDDVFDEEVTKESIKEDIDEYERLGRKGMYIGMLMLTASLVIPLFGYISLYYNEITQLELLISLIPSLGLFNLGCMFLISAVISGDVVRENNIIMYRLQMMYENDSQNEGDSQ